MEARLEKFPKSQVWGTANLIFATVGSSKTPFERLVKAVDDIAEQTLEEVVIQIGAAKKLPRCAKYFEFCDSERMIDLIERANVVISHAGFGIIADCIRMNKRLVLIPREHRFGDAEGNQVELAQYISQSSKGIICIRDVGRLPDALDRVRRITPNYQFTTRIPKMIQNFIDRKLG